MTPREHRAPKPLHVGRARATPRSRVEGQASGMKNRSHSCLADIGDLHDTYGSAAPRNGGEGFGLDTAARTRRPNFLLAVGELATPPALGAGDRRFNSCQPDLRGGGAAVLASLMSSRPWVRIPPAPFRGRSSAARALACQAIGRRFESGRPRSLVHGGCGVTAASEVVILAVPVRIRSVALSCGR